MRRRILYSLKYLARISECAYILLTKVQLNSGLTLFETAYTPGLLIFRRILKYIFIKMF